MHARGFHRCWLGLALMAMMLLSLLPTIGRLAQSQAPVHAAHAGIAEVALCTVQGLKQVALSLASATSLSQPDAPPPRPAHDCDYCPLLAGLVALAVVALLFWPQALPAPATHFRDARRIATRHPSGLGSRGPPLHG